MEITHTTDLILLHRWRASRDAEAFRALAERYAGLVFAAAHRVLRDPSEAEDVAQECFLTLSQARKPPERNLGAWLHTAAVNRAKNHIRGEVRRRQREQHYDALQSDRIQIELDDTLAHVDEAIAALDDELRHVIIAHFLEAKSQGEIADTTGVSRQTVNARVKRGIEAIREHLTRKGITSTTASLTALLGTQMVEAAPASLVAALGKVALSGGAVAGGGAIATLVGLLTTKVAAGLTAIIVAVLSFFTYQEHVSRTSRSTSQEPLNLAADGSEDALASESISSVAETVRAATGDLSVSPVLANGGKVLAGTILDENGDLISRTVTVYANANFPVGLKMDFDSPEGQRYANAHIVRHAESHNGAFELAAYTNPGAQGTIYAVDDENNLISDQQTFDLSRGDQRVITLRFRRYGSIAGKLLDRTGAPVWGAALTFSSSVGSFETGSDKEGQFVTAPLPPGKYHVSKAVLGDPFSPEQNHVEMPVSNPNVAVGDGEHVDSVSLACDCELTQISGRVTDEQGSGIPNLRILLKDASIATAGPVRTYKLFGVTDDHGEFDLNVYGPGIYKLDVVSSDYELPEPVTVRSGEIDLELHARVGGKKTLRFQVVNGVTGERVDSYVSANIEGPNVTGDSWQWESGGAMVTSMSMEEATGATATFASEGVGVATYPIKLSDLGGPEILIRLEPVAPIEGQVLDSEGNPKANVCIHDTPVSEWEPRTRTDANGHFQFSDLRPGQTTVYVFSDDAPQMQVPIERDGKWVIRLTRGATISGVATANGKPMKGLALELCSRASDVPGEVRKRATTDGKGFYEFRGVASGTATLLASAPEEMDGVILGAMQQEVEVVLDKTVHVDFALDVRTPDASLRGMMYAGGLPVNGGVSVQRADDNRNWGTSSEPFNAAEGYRIENLRSGDVVVGASRGRSWKRIRHRLTAGENTLDILFSKSGAILECTFPIPPEKVDSIQTFIKVETEFGEESLADTRIPITQSGIRVDDLPEGTASVRFEILEKGSRHVKNFERKVDLVSGSISTINFGDDSASLTIAVSGVLDSERIVIRLLPGTPSLPDLESMNPQAFVEHMDSMQPAHILEREDLDRPLQSLDAGIYTLFALAYTEAGPDADPGILPPGFRTVATEVTLEPEFEAQVTLAFP